MMGTGFQPESAPRVPELQGAAAARTTALARRFGDALRVGEGRTADRLINEALAGGMAPAAIQSRVIAPAMVRIGELWEAGVVTVADEHLATSLSHRGLIRLFETMTADRPRGPSRGRVLLAAVEGQQHVLGLRMAADVLEAAGFDVLYLGADVPVASLQTILTRHRPAVVGLAFGIAARVSCLADALLAIHQSAPDTRIMLGGRAVPPGLGSTGYPHVATSMEVVDAVETILAGPAQPLPAVVDVLRSDGERRPARSSREACVPGIAESLARAAEEAVDIAREHVRRAEAYREPRLRDPLTALASRRALMDALRTRADASGHHGALLVLDIDAFRAVNDEHGEQGGDRLLRAVGQAIAGAVGPGDLAARLGGDAFAVLLAGAGQAAACETGNRIRTAVRSSVDAPVTVSAGAAAVSADPRRTLLAAGRALVEAKAAGGDRIVADPWPPRGAGVAGS